VEQIVKIVEEYDKKRALYDVLEKAMDGSKILIFTGTKRTADIITRQLREDGWPARAIHGDKSQNERDWVLEEFKSSKSPIMVATDVASRGLDVKDISTVINYDFPMQIEDYVHRIGRTGRAGATGQSFTFFTSADAKKAKELVNVLKMANQDVPDALSKMASHMAGQSSGRSRYRTGGGGGDRDRDRGGFSGSNNAPLGGGRGSSSSSHGSYPSSSGSSGYPSSSGYSGSSSSSSSSGYPSSGHPRY